MKHSTAEKQVTVKREEMRSDEHFEELEMSVKVEIPVKDIVLTVIIDSLKRYKRMKQKKTR